MRTRVEALEIPIGDQCLAGTLLSPAARLPAVLFVHGWGGGQEQDLVRAREASGRSRRARGSPAMR